MIQSYQSRNNLLDCLFSKQKILTTNYNGPKTECVNGCRPVCNFMNALTKF